MLRVAVADPRWLLHCDGLIRHQQRSCRNQHGVRILHHLGDRRWQTLSRQFESTRHGALHAQLIMSIMMTAAPASLAMAYLGQFPDYCRSQHPRNRHFARDDDYASVYALRSTEYRGCRCRAHCHRRFRWRTATATHRCDAHAVRFAAPFITIDACLPLILLSFFKFTGFCVPLPHQDGSVGPSLDRHLSSGGGLFLLDEKADVSVN